MSTHSIFEGFDNAFGRLQEPERERLQAVLDNPCEKTWDNAFSIILSWERNYTLWQAVIAVDPTFPRTGPRTGPRGRKLESWSRVPNRDTLLRAMLFASKPKTVLQ